MKSLTKEKLFENSRTVNPFFVKVTQPPLLDSELNPNKPIGGKAYHVLWSPNTIAPSNNSLVSFTITTKNLAGSISYTFTNVIFNDPNYTEIIAEIVNKVVGLLACYAYNPTGDTGFVILMQEGYEFDFVWDAIEDNKFSDFKNVTAGVDVQDTVTCCIASIDTGASEGDYSYLRYRYNATEYFDIVPSMIDTFLPTNAQLQTTDQTAQVLPPTWSLAGELITINVYGGGLPAQVVGTTFGELFDFLRSDIEFTRRFRIKEQTINKNAVVSDSIDHNPVIVNDTNTTSTNTSVETVVYMLINNPDSNLINTWLAIPNGQFSTVTTYNKRIHSLDCAFADRIFVSRGKYLGYVGIHSGLTPTSII